MYAFIVNPNARSGLGMKIWRQTEALLKEKKIDYQACLTRYPGHASDFARELTSRAPVPTLVILGGDGTLNEAVNGITSLSGVTLGCIPIGSSNDFARSMKLSGNPEEALANILDPPGYTYLNVGRLDYDGGGRRFAVSCGIGYDAEVTVRLQKQSRFKKFLNKLHLGKISYTAVALSRLLKLDPGTMRLRLDGGRELVFRKVYFAAAMNHRYEGGGFKFCPKADPGDDLLDIILVAGLPRLKALALLPTAYVGLHVYAKGIYTCTCRKAEIISDACLPVHTDGEPLAAKTNVSYSLEPEKIRLIRS